MLDGAIAGKQEPGRPLEELTNCRVIRVGGVSIGNGTPVIIAGPCSVESEAQIRESALAVKRAGAQILRGGAFKPRTSPHSFQGLGIDGLILLREAANEAEMPIVTEVMSEDMVDVVAEFADLVQVGARNMQNFALLKKLAKIQKPILLKRGPAATVSEWLSSADYLLSGGNDRVILCERGIRGFDPALRNVLDLGTVALLKATSTLPVIVDPSHALGKRSLIAAGVRAALAVGADGVMVEVHPTPETALSDKEQQLSCQEFAELMNDLRRTRCGTAEKAAFV